MRSLLLPCVALLTVVVSTCCSPPSRTGEAEHESASPVPRAAALRWQARAGENGRVPEGALYQAAAELKARLAAAPQAAGGPVNWTLLGPGNIAGRTRSILIHPTTPNTMWVGSVSGGVWKTTDGGSSWQMLPDLPAVIAINCMAMDPTDPDVLYAGTGEQSFFNVPEGSSNSAVNVGAGVFKSTDGGTSWTQLPATAGSAWSSVNRIAIDPGNPMVLVAATISGIWRSVDGGASWSQRTTGVTADVKIDPNDASNYVAGRLDGTARYSTDGGQTWTATAPFGTATRIELQYARSSPGMVYASASDRGALVPWRSLDGGRTWVRTSTGSVVSTLSNYDNALWVDPTNSNIVIVGGLDLFRSTNAGSSFSRISSWNRYPNSAHADQHAIVEHPNFNGSSNLTVYFANDGGIQRASNVYTVSSTSGWTNLARGLATTQLYGACINPTSGVVLGGAQDNGTVRGAPANGLDGWTSPLGGDGSFCASDPTDPNVFYLQYYYLNLYRSTNGGASQGASIKGAINEPSPNFMAYILLDPNDRNRLYACGERLWRTNNARTGNPPSWTAVKPAIACPTADDPPPAHFDPNPPCNISTVAVAPGNADVVWVGHNNGAVYYTTNGLAGSPSWTKVDDNGPGLPDRWVSRIVIDADDSTKVTVSFLGFAPDNVWRTTNSGASWSPRHGSGAGALPPVPVSCIARHRVVGTRMYAATDLGLFYTEDDGQSWRAAAGGPTIVPIDEIVWKNDRTLLVATHGRSIWTCDVDPASVTPVGPGCGIAAVPGVTATPPVIGAVQTYTLAGATANAPASLILAGGPPNPIPIGPCVVQPALASPLVLAIGNTNVAGGLVTNVPVPPDGTLLGATMTAQEFIAVVGGPLLGVGELSNGLRLVFGF